MELKEAVKVGMADVESEDAPTCDKQEDKKKYGWKARVNKWGSEGTKCSGANLYEDKSDGMWARRDVHFKEKSLGFVPEKKGNEHWASEGLAAVGPESFPLQAHHLIPKNTLPEHDICVWLCEGWHKDDDYQLIEDTPYNTDHANNGYAMPDALRLKEWKNAKSDQVKTGVAFRVMDKTKIQLHQGSHAADLDPEKIKQWLKSGKLPPIEAVAGSGDSDAFEDAQIHDDGYVNSVKKFLNAAAGRLKKHVDTCTKGCKKGESKGKTQVRPLLDAVRLMDRVSYIAKVFLQMNIIFACPYGTAYALTRRLLTWDNGQHQYFIQKQTPTGVEDLTIADLKEALEAREG